MRNDACPEERGLWATGHKGRTGPHCPVTFIKFLFITHEALYMQDLIRFLQYFECGVVSLL